MKKKTYSKNPFPMEEEQEYNVFKLHDITKLIMIYIMQYTNRIEVDLSLKTLQRISDKSKPTIIKGIKELIEYKLIAKSKNKSMFFINPKMVNDMIALQRLN